MTFWVKFIEYSISALPECAADVVLGVICGLDCGHVLVDWTLWLGKLLHCAPSSLTLQYTSLPLFVLSVVHIHLASSLTFCILLPGDEEPWCLCSTAAGQEESSKSAEAHSPGTGDERHFHVASVTWPLLKDPRIPSGPPWSFAWIATTLVPLGMMILVASFHSLYVALSRTSGHPSVNTLVHSLSHVMKPVKWDQSKMRYLVI